LVVRLVLRHQIAGFAAGLAIVLAIGTEADIVPTLAENAEAITFALFLFPIALRAKVGHAPRVARFAASLK